MKNTFPLLIAVVIYLFIPQFVFSQKSNSNEKLISTPALNDWTNADVLDLKQDIKEQVQKLHSRAALAVSANETKYTLGNYIGQALIRQIRLTEIIDLYDKQVITRDVIKSVFEYLHYYENLKYMRLGDNYEATVYDQLTQDFVRFYGGNANDLLQIDDDPAETTPSGEYTLTPFTQGMSLLSGATTIYNGAVSNYDDESSDLNLGFDFFFYPMDDGDVNTAVRVSTNGYITFYQQGGGALDGIDPSNNNITSAINPDGFIAPWWDDLIVTNQGTSDMIKYKIENIGGEDVMIIEYYSITRKGGATNDHHYFQVQLFEGSNDIELHYGNWMADTDDNATVGMEDYAGEDGDCGPNCTNTNSARPLNNYRFQLTSGIWTGNDNYDWDNSSNWNNFSIPDISTDVFIPSGRPKHPHLTGDLGVDTTSALIEYTCHSLEIESGASLVIYASGADLISQGTIDLDGLLDVSDDIYLFDGSVMNLQESTSEIMNGRYTGFHGKTFLFTGSVVNQSDGDVRTEELYVEDGAQYNGDGGNFLIYTSGSVPSIQTIEIDDPDSYFYDFHVMFSYAALNNSSYDLETTQFSLGQSSSFKLSNDSISASQFIVYNVLSSPASLIIEGGVIQTTGSFGFEPGTSFEMSGGKISCGSYFYMYGSVSTSVTAGEIFVNDNFISHNQSFQATGGTVTLVGNQNSDVDGSPSFYNLVIQKTSPYYALTQSDTLFVRNNFTIASGHYDTNDDPVFVGRNWTNNMGDAGFVEGSGTVTFNGSGPSDITTNETFYDLVLDKTTTGYNAMEIMAGLTIYINDDLRILDGGMELNSNSSLIIGDTIFIEQYAGLNAYNDVNLSIEVGGIWINNNTYYNYAGVGFSPGTSLVTFNGSANATIEFNADYESFYKLFLNKIGDTLFFGDSLRIGSDIHILNGVLHKIGTPHTTLEGDLIIESTGHWHAGDLLLTGLADQVISDESSSIFEEIMIDKISATMVFIPQGDTSGTGAEIAKIPENAIDGPLDQTVTFLENMKLYTSSSLIVEEGTLQCEDIELYISGDLIINDGGHFIMDPGGIIHILDVNQKIVVNSGGILETIGNITDFVTITHWTMPFGGVVVRNGGTIKSSYTIFEHMVDSAVFIKHGGIIDPATAFSYCIFRNGDSGGTLLTIDNDQTLTINDASFPSNTWSGSHNVAKTIDQGEVTFTNTYGLFAGPAYENDPYNRINWSGEGTWLGNISSNWFTASNWLFELVPNSSRNALIPGGTPYDPEISGNAYCKDLEIQAGASLTISDLLDVSGDMVIAGSIDLDNGSSSILQVDGDITWSAGAQGSTTVNSAMVIRGDWIFENGSNVHLDEGIIYFNGMFSQQIISHESNSYFSHVRAVSSDHLVFSALSTDSTNIRGYLYIGFGTIVTVNSVNPVLLENSLINEGGQFHAAAGEVVFDGPLGADIVPEAGDYFNNLKISADLPVYQDNTNTDTLVVMGDLRIEPSGSKGTVFDTENNVTVVYGDWTNNVGDSGFEEGSGTVIFMGSAPSIIVTEETFYNLTISKQYPNFDGVSAGNGNASGVDITILNDLDILDGTFELNNPCTLTVGNDLSIALNAGLNANDVPFNIYNGGSWDNENTTFSTTAGFSHDNQGNVIFNGQHSSAQNITQQTSFWNIRIDRPGPYRVRPFSSNLYANNIDVISGILRTGGRTIKANNDVNIHDQLEMTSSVLDSLIVNSDIRWENGSGANTTTGEIMVYSDWTFASGADVQIDTGCHVRITGSSASYFYCMEPDASIGHMTIDKDTTGMPRAYIAGSSTHDLQVTGNFIVSEGNEFRIQGDDLLINGTCLIDTGAMISMSTSYGYLGVDSTLFLIGHLDIYEGTAIVNGVFSCTHPSALISISGDGYCACDSYEQGGHLHISSGEFIAYDVPEQGLYGTYLLHNGSITIHQDISSYIDLFADVTVHGGTFAIYGGKEHSYWPGVSSAATIEMDGGVFDFRDVGISLRTGLSAMISDGIIKTGKSFTSTTTMSTFNPTGGIVEIYGGDDGQVGLGSGSFFHDLHINKNATDRVDVKDPIIIHNELRLVNGIFDTKGISVIVGN